MQNKSKLFCVYMHIFPNNKRYIGITCQKPEYRWRSDGGGYKPRNNQAPNRIWGAILKYGWNNVRHEILFVNLTKEEACKKEKELIAFYKSNDRHFGYNIEDGGDVKTLTDETKRKISESRTGKNYGLVGENAPFYGKRHTEESKERISLALTGESNPMYGRHHTDETKNKLMEFHLDHSKAVAQYDKNKNFIRSYTSIHDASRKTGIKKCNISAVINGRQRTAGGYIWELLETNMSIAV